MGDVGSSTGGEAFNGAPRIHVRVGKGQATDPHSVVERMRKYSIFHFETPFLFQIF